MSKNKKQTRIKKDPLAELNEIVTEVPIEIESKIDPLDILEKKNQNNIPTYDNKSHTIINNKYCDIPEELTTIKSEEDISNSPLFKVIDEVAVTDEPVDESEEILEKLQSKTEIKEDKKEKASLKKEKPKNTHVIDEVKVDDEGIPLLNQFNTDKLRELNIFKKSKHNIRRIIAIVVGICMMVYGFIQALNDTVKISDSVMYGEHETMAIMLIALGILIILLSFYKEIMKYVGFEQSEEIETKNNQKKEKQQ